MNDVQLQTELQNIMQQNNWNHESMLQRMYYEIRQIGVTKEMIENLLKKPQNNT